MPILAVGLNHRTAPVEVREKLAFSAQDQALALARLTGAYGIHEAAILATCNRSELYVAAPGDAATCTTRFLTEEHGVEPDLVRTHGYQLRDGAAVQHLFRVACGIDSLVVGESQILKQVRDALTQAQHAGSARLLLNELFQRSLHVGKRARAETDIGRGRLSISTAAVELAGRIFADLSACDALLLGAGEMAELTAQYLVDGQLRTLRVANRTASRAAELARRFGGTAVPLTELARQLTQVDIVIAATAARHFVIDPEMVRAAMRQRRGRPLFLIDIAVPRDVDPGVRDLDNVYLFDIDDLEEVVESNRSEREAEIRKVEVLVEEELSGFLQWYAGLSAAPLIRALRDQTAALQETELSRWSGKLASLDDDQRALVEAVLKGYANKLLHQPQVEIRRLAGADDGYAQLATVRRLFGLDPAHDEEGRP